MRGIRSILLILLVLFFCNWGFLVHRTIHQLAVYELPASMRPFFYRNMQYLVDNAGRPDQRRNQDSSEGAKHYINLEAFGDSAAWKMPLRWEDVIKKFPKDSLLKYGYVPYHIITMKNRLTNAFRALNKDSILFYANDLAHYIGDANVPLHTSVNYDGQLSHQQGLHSLWESMIPELEIEKYNLYSGHKASYIRNPEQAVWDCIRRAHQLLPDVFGKEIEASKGFNDSTKFRVQVRRGKEVKSFTTAFARAYNQLLKQTVNEQLLRATDMIADFWYTAWVDAGKPDLSSLIPDFSDTRKNELKEEMKAWKQNELIGKKLLLSRKQQESK